MVISVYSIEIIAEIYPSKASAKKCKALGIVCKVQHLRFICIEFDSGEKEVLVTNSMDEKEFPYDEFVDLYHLRWFVEESYKRMKSRLEIENYKYITHLEKLFISNLELIRPNRHIERKFRKSKRIYPIPYKNSF